MLEIADGIDINLVNFNQDSDDKHDDKINKNTNENEKQSELCSSKNNTLIDNKNINENEITNNNTKKSSTIFVSPIKIVMYWIYGDTLDQFNQAK